MTDDLLIEGLKAKDKKAFNALFDRLFAQVYYYTQNIINDKIEAEDITIHSFAKFWESANKYSSIKEVKNFIYKTARNACIDYLNKLKAQNNYRNYILHISKFVLDNSEERILYEGQMLEKLKQEVDKLPEQCRKVFKLVFLEKYSREEVSQRLQISMSTVHVQCANALKRLKQVLSKEEFFLLLLLCGILS